MVTKIVIKLELGHVAKTLNVATSSGHTHEWMVFVKGADEMNIQHFVEKVVFWLHDSYDPPKCVVKSPPYQVKQSGYAGFNILIDIHFKNKSEPKSVRFRYDLFLHKENMPPVNHTRIEMLTFTNPADDFKKRLIRAGGIVKTQESQSKEKKAHKDIRHSDDRQEHSTKEKHGSVKMKLKHNRPDVKSSGPSSKKERHSSVGDVEQKKKLKHQERSFASSPQLTNELKMKEKEKTKPKVKIDNLAMSGLFSREESIDMKQLKKKEDVKIEKDKRLETKIKSDNSGMNDIRTRIEPASSKRSKLKKAKKARSRSPSSSDSGASPVKVRLASTSSDVESERERHRVKRSAPDKVKMKMPKKRSKGSPEKLIKKVLSKPPIDKPSEMSTPRSPPSEHSRHLKLHRKRSGNEPDKKPKRPPPERSAFEAASQAQARDVPTIVSSKPRKEKRKDPLRLEMETVSEGRKPTPTHSRRKHELKRLDSSSSATSEDDVIEPALKTPPPVSPMSSTSSSSHDPFSERPPERGGVPKSPAQPDLSDGDQDSLEQDYPDPLDSSNEHSGDEKVFAHDEAASSNEEDAEEAAPRVVVGIGETFNHYPHMSDELFDQLRRLQALLATVTDESCLRKISSAVRKSGRFDEEQDAMRVDLCSLDRKTIHKIEKYVAGVVGE